MLGQQLLLLIGRGVMRFLAPANGELTVALAISVRRIQPVNATPSLETLTARCWRQEIFDN
jgi:hypothetical protein